MTFISERNQNLPFKPAKTLIPSKEVAASYAMVSKNERS
jgi:hypothetical protein